MSYFGHVKHYLYVEGNLKIIVNQERTTPIKEMIINH